MPTWKTVVAAVVCTAVTYPMVVVAIAAQLAARAAFEQPPGYRVPVVDHRGWIIQ